MIHRPSRRRPEAVGPDAADRSYYWMLMALLGAIGVWLIVFSLSVPAPAPIELPKVIVLEPEIESPVVNQPAIEPAIEPEPLQPSLLGPEIVQPEATNPVVVKPAKHHHKRLPKLRLAPRATAPAEPWDPSQDPSRYAYWLHVQ